MTNLNWIEWCCSMSLFFHRMPWPWSDWISFSLGALMSLMVRCFFYTETFALYFKPFTIGSVYHLQAVLCVLFPLSVRSETFERRSLVQRRLAGKGRKTKFTFEKCMKPSFVFSFAPFQILYLCFSGINHLLEIQVWNHFLLLV